MNVVLETMRRLNFVFFCKIKFLTKKNHQNYFSSVCTLIIVSSNCFYVIFWPQTILLFTDLLIVLLWLCYSHLSVVSKLTKLVLKNKTWKLTNYWFECFFHYLIVGIKLWMTAGNHTHTEPSHFLGFNRLAIWHTSILELKRNDSW